MLQDHELFSVKDRKESWDGGHMPVLLLSFSLATSPMVRIKQVVSSLDFFAVNPTAGDLILIL